MSSIYAAQLVTGAASAVTIEAVGRISLLSVVREKGRDRYMAVEQILGDAADCAWFEGSERVTRRFPIASLEVVSALDADDQRWREAFRAATQKRVG